MKPRSLAKISEHFFTIFSHNFFSIRAKHGGRSRAPSWRPMMSLSHDPFRFPFLPNAKFIGHVEPSGEGRPLVFPRLICGFDL